MLSILFFSLAALFNALMDWCENENFHESPLADHVDEKFWYKRESWKYAQKIGGYPLDGWHILKSLMVICMALAAITYEPIFTHWVDFLLFGVLWNAVFIAIYHKLLGVK